MTGLQRPYPFTSYWDPFWALLLLYIKVVFLHIYSNLRGKGRELKLSTAVRMSPQWKSDLISPPILWQVSWCTRLIVFNLHSLVAYQATDGEIENKTPHISSTDCASHFATSLLFKRTCQEPQYQFNPCSLQRHFGNMKALRGLACQPLQPLFASVFPEWS